MPHHKRDCWTLFFSFDVLEFFKQIKWPQLLWSMIIYINDIHAIIRLWRYEFESPLNLRDRYRYQNLILLFFLLLISLFFHFLSVSQASHFLKPKTTFLSLFSSFRFYGILKTIKEHLVAFSFKDVSIVWSIMDWGNWALVFDFLGFFFDWKLILRCFWDWLCLIFNCPSSAAESSRNPQNETTWKEIHLPSEWLEFIENEEHFVKQTRKHKIF